MFTSSFIQPLSSLIYLEHTTFIYSSYISIMSIHTTLFFLYISNVYSYLIYYL